MPTCYLLYGNKGRSGKDGGRDTFCGKTQKQTTRPGTYVKFYIYVVPATSVFLPEASPKVSHQFPDKCEEGIIIWILGNLQVPVDKGAEVVGEEFSEDVIGEKLPQVQSVLQKEADKLGSVLYKRREHDFLKVCRLWRKPRDSDPMVSQGSKKCFLSQSHHISSHRVRVTSISLLILFGE